MEDPDNAGNLLTLEGRFDTILRPDIPSSRALVSLLSPVDEPLRVGCKRNER